MLFKMAPGRIIRDISNDPSHLALCLLTPLWFALSGKTLNLRFTTSPENDISAIVLEKCMREVKNLFHS